MLKRNLNLPLDHPLQLNQELMLQSMVSSYLVQYLGLIIEFLSYKQMAGSSQYKFGVLAKIVKHLKTLHLDGADHALTLEELLDETNQLDVGVKISQVYLMVLITSLSNIISRHVSSG